MSTLLWSVAAAAMGVVLLLLMSAARRTGRARQVVLEEVRRRLRGGVIEHLPARGPQARGRLGELEVTVDLHHDAQRRRESPMWRIMAVGPVRIAEPLEARIGNWQGWIDPWMKMEKVLTIPASGGPAFTLHARQPVTLEHPVIAALRRQGPALVDGGLHVQRDFMRAEVRFDQRPENNRGLFALLDAMTEISASEPTRSMGTGRFARVNFSRETG